MQAEPRATYRIQLQPGFGFESAAAIVPYLARLGISHLYCSPIWQAAPGSTHGYDIVDPTRLNAELGGEEGYRALLETLRANGMRLLLDIVPNHMAIVPQNPWWQDVLEHGAASRHARFFDVDWNGADNHGRDSILLPVLGDHYGRVLEAGELKLAVRGARFRLCYFEHDFPIDPATQGELLRAAAAQCRSERLATLGDICSQLGTQETATRERHLPVLDALLQELCRDKEIATAIAHEVERLNSDADALDALIQRQNYRLAFWRMAGQQLGYRRFFDIHTLAGLRMEDSRVFDAVHQLAFRLFESETLEGLRIDHPDGLREPATYFSRLRDALPRAWLLAEKILMPGERLPGDWAVDGTTGYEFLNLVSGLFVDSEGLAAIDAFYREFTGCESDFDAVVRQSKRAVGSEVLGSELNRLAGLLEEICQRHRRHRDYTVQELRRGVNELAASFPVYRTYVQDGQAQMTETDRQHVATAVDRALAEQTDVDPELFRFIGSILLLQLPGEREREFVMRFQQFTAPLMAKGLEDTALYRFCRLVCCNDVGGDPGRCAVSPAAFHHACESRQHGYPLAMLTTDTHDTKFSADVRARLAVLSEMPAQWCEAVRRWDARLQAICPGEFPEANTRYLFYQALLGAWPIDEMRMLAFIEKAAREMKQHTGWLRQDATYERALQRFVQVAFSDRDFLADTATFARQLAEPGHRNSLAQVLLKLTAPGVPDIYQGTESWAHSLVDPDNRRAVDFVQLQARLETLDDDVSPEHVFAHSDEGMPKLWLTHRALELRRQRPRAFGKGAAYRAVSVHGEHGAHLLAYTRGDDVLVVAPRRALVTDWGSAMVDIPAGQWRDVLTHTAWSGGRAPAGELLSQFPVALLARSGD